MCGESGGAFLAYLIIRADDPPVLDGKLKIIIAIVRFKFNVINSDSVVAVTLYFYIVGVCFWYADVRQGKA